jgi:hypothetical protein
MDEFVAFRVRALVCLSVYLGKKFSASHADRPWLLAVYVRQRFRTLFVVVSSPLVVYVHQRIIASITCVQFRLTTTGS